MVKPLCRALVSLLVIGAVAAPAPAAPPSRGTYVRRVQAQVDDIAARLRTLDGRTGEVAADRRGRFEEAMKGLWKKERLARVQLEQLKHASEANWKKLRAAEDATLIRLNKSYRYVVNHYLTK